MDRQERILEAVLRLLAEPGISGLSMRAVAREAGVALGLVNYSYEDKASLIRAALRRVADPEFLTTEYLSLRLQLWSLAPAHPDFDQINTAAQKRYRAGLAALIRAAGPALSRAECARRAADIDVLQNGLWLTALLGLDRAAIRRCLARCEEIALAPLSVVERSSKHRAYRALVA